MSTMSGRRIGGGVQKVVEGGEDACVHKISGHRLQFFGVFSTSTDIWRSVSKNSVSDFFFPFFWGPRNELNFGMWRWT